MFYAYVGEKTRGPIVALDKERVKEIKKMNQDGELPDELVDRIAQMAFESTQEKEIEYEDVTGEIELPALQKKKRPNKKKRPSNKSGNKPRGEGSSDNKPNEGNARGRKPNPRNKQTRTNKPKQNAQGNPETPNAEGKQNPGDKPVNKRRPNKRRNNKNKPNSGPKPDEGGEKKSDV